MRGVNARAPAASLEARPFHRSGRGAEVHDARRHLEGAPPLGIIEERLGGEPEAGGKMAPMIGETDPP